jgi:hypothetical protein
MDGNGRPEEPEIRAEIERICASREFHRSEQCKRFLSHVCDLALLGHADHINECSIGVEIFHRPPDYSPAEDGVVRRQAHILRRKLEAYYGGEGRSDKVRVDLPVGRYVPVFCLQTRDDGVQSESLAAPLQQAHWKRLAGVAGAVVLAAVFFVAGRWTAHPATLSGANPAPGSPPRAVEEIWGPWFHDPSGVTICLANSKAAVVHHVQDARRPDSHPEHFRPDAGAERGLRQFFKFPPGGYLFYRPSESKTGIAESIAAVTVAQMFGRYGVAVRASEGRLLNWGDLRTANFVLLGHNEANPWVDKLLHKCPFRLADSLGIRRSIENTQPQPGEQPSYFKEGAGASIDPVIDYGLTSMLPGLDDRHQLLLVTGLDGQASQMASEFLTQPARLDQLLARLKAIAPTHSGPWYFQFVIRAEVREKLATRADIVAVRVLSRQN